MIPIPQRYVPMKQIHRKTMHIHDRLISGIPKPESQITVPTGRFPEGFNCFCEEFTILQNEQTDSSPWLQEDERWFNVSSHFDQNGWYVLYDRFIIENIQKSLFSDFQLLFPQVRIEFVGMNYCAYSLNWSFSCYQRKVPEN